MTVNEALEVIDMLQSEDGKINREDVIKIMKMINGFTLSDKNVSSTTNRR